MDFVLMSNKSLFVERVPEHVVNPPEGVRELIYCGETNCLLREEREGVVFGVVKGDDMAYLVLSPETFGPISVTDNNWVLK